MESPEEHRSPEAEAALRRNDVGRVLCCSPRCEERGCEERGRVLCCTPRTSPADLARDSHGAPARDEAEHAALRGLVPASS